MSSRSRSIRSKLVLLLLVPLLSLTALWGFGAAITLSPGLHLLHVGSLVDIAKSGDALSSALQAERRAAAVQVAKPGPAAGQAFAAARRATDQARTTYFKRADDARSSLASAAVDDIDSYHGVIEHLDGTRSQVAAGQGTVNGVLSAYTTAITHAYTANDSTVGTVGDAAYAQRTRDVLDLARTREALSQEDAVMAAILARGGGLPAGQQSRFAAAMGVQRYEYQRVLPRQTQMVRSRFAAVTASASYQRLRGMENLVSYQTKPGATPDLTADQWAAVTRPLLSQQESALHAGEDELIAQGRPMAVRVLGEFLVATLFGLLAVAASLIISVRVSRNLIRELRQLRHRARAIAETRLPELVRRMRAGEEIDPDAEVQASAYRITELAQVDAAIGSVQRTAMEEAVGETRLRSGIRGVFVNLARRSQALLHRQLKLLDGMERATDDPGELEDLFQLDHLATRMRRHAEGLIILSGSTPGRSWRRPVPMIDVMRAAVAEVEDYQRITVAPMPDAALSGPAVADVVHLVAELLENATLYSPPHTEVSVSADHVGNGYVVEIVDRGLSMSPEDLAEANQKLSSPPEFDLTESARLGLFVVARLARRHGIRVSLRVSPYGGTTAIMMLPSDLIDTMGTTATDTGPFAERVRPAGVGAGPAVDTGDEGIAVTGRLRAAPEFSDSGGYPYDPEPVPHVRPVPDPPAEPAAGQRAGGEDPDVARRGPAGPYPGASPEELPQTKGGLPRRVRTEVRDAAGDDAPVTPAGAVPFAAPGERADEPVGDLFAPRTGPATGAEPAATEDPPDTRSRSGLPPLPRRVRQASIAPELRTDTRAADLELDLGISKAEPAGGRTPEQARSMMSSIQQGWVRGRAKDLGPDAQSGRTEPGQSAGEPAKEEHDR